jgi:hypothetical protein
MEAIDSKSLSPSLSSIEISHDERLPAEELELVAGSHDLRGGPRPCGWQHDGQRRSSGGPTGVRGLRRTSTSWSAARPVTELRSPGWRARPVEDLSLVASGAALWRTSASQLAVRPVAEVGLAVLGALR